MRKIAVSLFLFLLVPIVSVPQQETANKFSTGNDLLLAYSTCDLLAAGKTTPSKAGECFFLMGFVTGAAEVFDTQYPEAFVTDFEHMTMQEVIGVVHLYLKAHPEVLGLKAKDVVPFAIIDRWGTPQAKEMLKKKISQ